MNATATWLALPVRIWQYTSFILVLAHLSFFLRSPLLTHENDGTVPKSMKLICAFYEFTKRANRAY